MALAIRFDGLISKGAVHDHADLARRGHVTRARATQIMNLLNLAPDIQEKILMLSRAASGTDSLSERCVAAEADWRRQLSLWAKVVDNTRRGLRRAKQLATRLRSRGQKATRTIARLLLIRPVCKIR